MSKHYVLDGYNALYVLPEMPAGRWEEKRAALLTLLQKTRPQGKNRLTVVFDSRDGMGDRFKAGDIDVVYPASRSADDWIASYVRETANPRSVIVVTDDLGIRDMVRGTGAQWIRAKEFLALSSTKQTSRPREGTGPDDITEELKKKWL
jgi:predicted RNA-binding protein with PIN domain